MQSIKVIEEWILVKPEPEGERVSPGGIIMTGKAPEVVKRAEVVQISEHVPDLIKKEKGSEAELDYKVGDTVLFYGKTGIPIEDDKDKYMFLKYDGMLAIERK
jgi:co-chaperonin GroES (HSP10)